MWLAWVNLDEVCLEKLATATMEAAAPGSPNKFLEDGRVARLSRQS